MEISSRPEGFGLGSRTRQSGSATKSKSWIDRIGFWKTYTLLFTVVAVLCLCWFALAGSSFIWEGDGWSQHFRAYIYYGRWLREIAGSLLSGAGLVVPQWDFSFGEGNDVLDTLHYYAIGSPFTLGCAFVPDQYMHIYYDAMVVVRLYLAGLAFCKLCIECGLSNRHAIIAGAVTYAFCGWSAYCLWRHPFFLDPLIWMPLLVLGIERIIRNGKPWIFVWSVFLSCISNVYFAWMLALLAVVYLVVRLVFLNATRGQRPRILGRVFAYALLGIAMAAVIMVPMAGFVLGDTRSGGFNPAGLFYSIEDYALIFVSLMSVKPGGANWEWVSLGGPAILAALIALVKGDSKVIRTLLVIAFVFSLFPVLGQIFNGFSYAANRWSFALALVVCYALTANWEQLVEKPDRKTVLGLAIFLVIYAVICGCAVAIQPSSDNRILFAPIAWQIGLAFLFVGIAVLGTKRTGLPVQGLALSLAIAAVAINCFWMYTPAGYNFAGITIPSKLASSNLNASVVDKLPAPQDAFFRTTVEPQASEPKNANVTAGRSTTQYYWSFSNQAVAQYRTNLGMIEPLNYEYSGYEASTNLLANASVKYCAVASGKNTPLPYGYHFIEEIETGGSLPKGIASSTHSLSEYDIYENNYPMPFAYTTDSQMSSESWMGLGLVERQSVLPGTAVLKNTQDGISIVDTGSNTKTLHYRTKKKNLTLEDNGVKVTKKKSSLTLEFEGQNDSETYIELEGFDYPAAKNSNVPSEVTLNLELDDGTSTKLNYRTTSDLHYPDVHDFAINLGYHKSAPKKATLTFSNTGTYCFKSLKVKSLSMDGYREKIKKLQNRAAQNTVFTTNAVTADFNSEGDSLACFSIPYGKGWEASVDGRKTEVLQNLAYLAVPLESGHHTVELRYHTPYLSLGLSISAVAFAILILLSALQHRSRQIRGKHATK
ncbi:MAG: YfhO family protein [Eggerthellaceae bacterium]|jgi:uncharacterized membrane protein YfhO